CVVMEMKLLPIFPSRSGGGSQTPRASSPGTTHRPQRSGSGNGPATGHCSSPWREAPGKEEPGRERSSAHPLATVDIVGLGDDVFGFVAGKENRHAGELLGPAHPSVGHTLAHQPLLLAERPVLVFREERIDMVPMLAIHHPWRDGVDVDAMLDEVEPGRLGQ